MEPITLIVTILAVGLGVASLFWGQILAWCEEHLLPFLDRRMPFLSGIARSALVLLDRAVTTVRRAARAAWQHLRAALLKTVMIIRRTSDARWVQRFTSWAITQLEDGREQPLEVVTEREVAWEDLPNDLREALVRRCQTVEVDVTAARDAELELEVGH
ncbi:MAG TPA: hypothetical protein PK668_20955 [Myxococcota bacterium]|nr:hypothetical protein [Myxococcota bacterium]HRY96618.1 hypothetical protein [Myxococcota bacterium]HSA21413.1 hypothetical protein [Myxococcota bacterium]